ncbi:MAG: hypothetical protein RTU92_02630 [Candidatus Thorarchaeota archaeon]
MSKSKLKPAPADIMVKGPLKSRPRYGGRTMVEKVTAYKLSDGELVESRESALRWQKEIDIRDAIDMFVQEYLNPFLATSVRNEYDKEVLCLEHEVVSFWSVKQMLHSEKFREWLKRLS